MPPAMAHARETGGAGRTGKEDELFSINDFNTYDGAPSFWQGESGLPKDSDSGVLLIA